ncbi:hypothetical protein Rhe02_91210 [Rhizocola hellebori]|uniref:Uncharacterized protein n=1 Tax=Rhizocola hellebori TaxID=1392758 RepID=A0A8J3QH70_9ACTN|nr:hypothetical protein [Rhizocola hellebori]GIH11054.1 hypothetical protein Rhe02_91210 [Rhizocola hellebori]
MRSRLAIALIAALFATGLVACTAGAAEAELTPAEVAVVVLDDFNLAVNPAPHDPNANCANTGRGANEIETGGGGDGLPAGVTHGKAVYDTLQRSLQDVGYTSVGPLDIRRAPLVPGYLSNWKHPGLGKRLLLLGMDTADFDTARIAIDLEATLEYLRTAFGITRFVLNMSFVITPCDVPGWLAANGAAVTNAALVDAYHRMVDRNPHADRLHSLINSLAGSSPAARLPADLHGNQELREITQRVATNLFYDLWTTRTIDQLRHITDLAGRGFLRVTIEDPLQSYLSGNPFAGGVSTVGAAGNGVHRADGRLVQINFPFAPAIWNPVVSASALHSGLRAEYSNSGEVMLDGTATIAGRPPTPRVRGTSFAAPRLSARQALHLTRGYPNTCAADGRSAELPPLGYTDITAEPGTPQWNNLTLDVAVSAHCPAFPAT